jgi:hypothetical protein
MADVNKTIEISYTANIGALERALKRIPGITEDQMKKAINEVEKELKQFEKASVKSAKSFKQKFSGMAKVPKMLERPSPAPVLRYWHLVNKSPMLPMIWWTHPQKRASLRKHYKV